MKTSELYLKTKGFFVHLCNITGMPVPRIREPEAPDTCDFTSHEEVRLNVVGAYNVTPERHAAHVFGHYLCDLHEWGNKEDHPICDEIADAIADLLDGPEGKGSCPCEWTEPCDPRCTCVHPVSSVGCKRCCRYGSDEQRKAQAEHLVKHE